MNSISTQQLKRALSIREQIEALEAELNSIFGGASPVRRGRPPGSGKRRMSAAGRRAIAAAQKRRWAKLKGGEEKPARKSRRKMSAAGRAKIAAATRERWKRAKTAGENRL
jgi:hypothetical protein